MKFPRPANDNIATVLKVHPFRYFVSGRTMAEIEVLETAGASFMSQGEIKKTQENISSGESYKTMDEALQSIYSIIEEKIKDDEWYIKSNKNFNN